MRAPTAEHLARVEAVPILDTGYAPGSYFAGMADSLAATAKKKGAVSETEAEAWLADLDRRRDSGDFFFCVNRFLVSAVKI